MDNQRLRYFAIVVLLCEWIHCQCVMFWNEPRVGDIMYGLRRFAAGLPPVHSLAAGDVANAPVCWGLVPFWGVLNVR